MLVEPFCTLALCSCRVAPATVTRLFQSLGSRPDWSIDDLSWMIGYFPLQSYAFEFDVTRLGAFMPTLHGVSFTHGWGLHLYLCCFDELMSSPCCKALSGCSLFQSVTALEPPFLGHDLQQLLGWVGPHRQTHALP